jgi:acyl-CoA thioesterase-1
MRGTWWKGWALLLVAAGSAVFAADAPNANGGKKRLVILGDSITAGYGLDPAEAYPALLQAKIDAAGLPYTVANAGVSGDTSAGGLRRIAWVLGKDGADALIVALGGNDGLRGISPEQTRANLAGIIDRARAKNPAMKIVVAGMRMPDNMGDAFTARFQAVFREIATEKKTALVPFLLDGVGGVESLNQADRIHPTAAGQAKIAETVWQVLEKELPR